MASSVLVEQKYLLPDNYTSVMFQILMYAFVNNIDLSQGEIRALSHFYIDGVNPDTENSIIEKNIFSSRQSLKNLKTKLNHLNIISKKDKVYTINNFMGVAAADKVLINIKAGNR